MTYNAHGDITEPNAWTDTGNHIPPLQWNNMPPGVSFPNNGDGRYWFTANAFAPTNGPIHFIGDPALLGTGTVSFTWSVQGISNDGSSLNIAYSTDGVTYTTVQIATQAQFNGLQNGQITLPLTGVANLYLKVTATGGASSSTATLGIVAISINRNANETLTWDQLATNPFDPINYNCSRLDFSGYPSATLGALRTRLAIDVGFASQSANLPPGIQLFLNNKLIAAQNYLYRKYSALHTRRFFRWTVNPGQRFYSLKDNDEDVLGNFRLDPMKKIEWVGIQDTRNVWYPMLEGIPPELYTMITKPWRPARYDIRQAIEVYPQPDQTYFLWMRANFGLLSFAADSDTTTIDSELVFLHALATSKAHYGHPDANDWAAMANSYRGELIAGTHKTAHYIPGVIPVPPAVRPTLIQFNPTGS